MAVSNIITSHRCVLNNFKIGKKMCVKAGSKVHMFLMTHVFSIVLTWRPILCNRTAISVGAFFDSRVGALSLFWDCTFCMSGVRSQTRVNQDIYYAQSLASLCEFVKAEINRLVNLFPYNLTTTCTSSKLLNAWSIKPKPKLFCWRAHKICKIMLLLG